MMYQNDAKLCFYTTYGQFEDERCKCHVAHVVFFVVLARPQSRQVGEQRRESIDVVPAIV
jgi:hypothetical protein